MRRIVTNISAAIASLNENKGRSALSALGIMVGSMAIVLLISIAKGVQADIAREVNDLGANLVIVLPARIEEDSMFAPGLMGMSYLTERDIEIVRGVDGVKKVVPLSFAGSGVQYEKKKSPTTLMIATKPDWFWMHRAPLMEGSYFTDADSHEAVCVIGSYAYKKLFGTGSVIGMKVRFNEQEFRIVGVTKNRDQSSSLFSMGSLENVMYVPYDYLKSKSPNLPINRIMAQTSPEKEPKALVATLDRLLGENLARETYSVITQEDLLRIVFKVMEILTWLLTGLTSIALFVGGVGIMTIMLMAVNSRTKEIGIRKTVGGRRADIFQQFLVESMVLGLTGGVIGLIFSWIVAVALAQYTPIKPMITFGTVCLSFAVCLGVGAVFGLIPALRAANKDPVESMRIE